jgi:cold shock protein
MPIGYVKWYNLEKGFGFIQHYQEVQDVFARVTDVKPVGWHELDPGQFVEFDVEPDRRGRRCAVSLRTVGRGWG